MHNSLQDDVFAPVVHRMSTSPVEDKTAIAISWQRENPAKAQNLVEELTRYVSEAPIHAALLGPICERYGVPKPISAFIRLYPQFRILGASSHFTKSPALCLASKMNDPEYWSRLRRKSPDALSPTADFNPWASFGVQDPNRPFGAVRIDIFAAFLYANYGTQLKDLAAVCSAFKRLSGVSFQGFFNGLRPAEFQRHQLAAARFTWSWTTDNPPCLYCSTRRPPYVWSESIAPDPALVSKLLPLVSRYMPEDIDFISFAQVNHANLGGVYLSYLAALRQALRITSDARASEKPLPRIDMDLARELYSDAKKGLILYANVISKIEKLFPELAH